jgi:glutaredoxin 2
MERVSYGNKYKHISTINGATLLQQVERHVEPVTRHVCLPVRRLLRRRMTAQVWPSQRTSSRKQGENTAASNNIGNAVTLNQTQDGYLSQVTSALDRMSELAVQSQDVTKSDSDRALYQKEFSTLASYVNNVSTENFNGVSLFGGTALNVTIDSGGEHVRHARC